MLGVLKRREVKALLRNHRPAVVARLAGVSVSSVKRISKEPDVFHLDDAAERKRRRIGRPSKVRSYRPAVEATLERTPDVRSVEILRQVRHLGYAGGKTALYSLVAEVRAEQERLRRGQERSAGVATGRFPAPDADRGRASDPIKDQIGQFDPDLGLPQNPRSGVNLR